MGQASPEAIHAESDRLQVIATIPLDETRIFVRHVEIEKAWRRQGYGTAALLVMGNFYGRAISPVRERHEYVWQQLRRWSGGKFAVTSAVDQDNLRDIVAERHRRRLQSDPSPQSPHPVRQRRDCSNAV